MGIKCGASLAAVVAAIFLTLASVSETGLAAKITVGGSEHWHFGFNYTDWASKTAPFYQNDTLVFKYDPPNGTTFPHSVYLLKGAGRFGSCNLKGAQMVGNETQGGGLGLEFVLKKHKPHYFACGEHGGVHCKDGLMRFAVHPLRRACDG